MTTAADAERIEPAVPPAGPADQAAPSRGAPAGPKALPSLVERMAARAAGPLGGAWGRHAGVQRWSWWTPLRWVLVMTMATLLLGFAQKAPCTSGVWDGNKQYTHFCYSDVVPLWNDERLEAGGVPYRDTTVEYPVLTGGFMWLTAQLTRGVHAINSGWQELVLFGVLTALLLSLCALVVAAATAQTARGRPYDAAIFALSPLLIFHAFSNWDLFAMAFASGALWAWARGKPVLAGALIGLGAAAKLYPVFLLVALLILAWRTRRFADPLWATATAGLTWLAVNGPIALAHYRGWWEFYRFSIERPTERSTVWAIGRTFTSGSVTGNDAPYWVPPGPAVAVALLLALGVVTYVGLRAPFRPRLAQLAFLCVLAFVVTTKVWSPQYSLWLVPLLALARPRWRLNLVWQFTEVVVWILTLTVLLGFAVPDHGISYGWLMVVLVVRDVLLLALGALVVRDMWCPWLDPIRADGTDDPGGGIFEGAPDHVGSRPDPVGPGPEWIDEDQIDVRR